MAYQPDIRKIDALAVDGLSGVANSLAYKVHEIEKHFHNDGKIYGNTSNAMAADVPIVFTVTGGDNAWGTELLLTDGTVIGGGSGTTKFDLHRMYITAATAANKNSIIHFISNVFGTPITSVSTTDVGDVFGKVAHGLLDGGKVVLNTIATTTGINAYTVYYKEEIPSLENDFSRFALYKLYLIGRPVPTITYNFTF